MKLTAVQNVKFLRLKRRLKLAHWQAVGLLESLWLFTQANAPAGDVGRHSNEDIAASIEWDGDADSLIESLVECGWIDDDEDHRLLIHDWADHVPTYLKGAMAKHGKDFAKQSAKQPAKHSPKQPAKHDAKQTQNVSEQPAPCLTLPSVGESRVNTCVAERHEDEGDVEWDGPHNIDPHPVPNGKPRKPSPYSPEFEEFWQTYPAYRRTAKGTAWKAWQKATKDTTPAELIDKAEEYAESPKGKGEFSVMPATWLNGRCWEDDPTAWGLPPKKQIRVLMAKDAEEYSPN